MLAPGSNAVLQPIAPAVRRIADDGEAYTYAEFLIYYKSQSECRWNRASVYAPQLDEWQDSEAFLRLLQNLQLNVTLLTLTSSLALRSPELRQHPLTPLT